MGESFFLEGNVFNDDRADFKTKNQQFPAEARLQQNFWVSCASRTSPNTGDVVITWGRRRRRAGRRIEWPKWWSRGRR